MTDLALDTEITSEQRGYLEGVKSSADSLLRILNDILDFSKIEAGKLALEEAPFDLECLLEDVESLLSFKAREKSLELALYSLIGLPVNRIASSRFRVPR